MKRVFSITGILIVCECILCVFASNTDTVSSGTGPVVRENIGENDYDFVEPVLSARCAVLSALRHRNVYNSSSSSMEELLLSWASTARHARRFQVGRRTPK